MIDRDTAARHAARGLYADDECEVDADAAVVHLDEPDTGVEGAAWVQCWRLVPAAAVERVAEGHPAGRNLEQIAREAASLQRNEGSPERTP